jgi:hypothetical protein
MAGRPFLVLPLRFSTLSLLHPVSAWASVMQQTCSVDFSWAQVMVDIWTAAAAERVFNQRCMPTATFHMCSWLAYPLTPSETQTHWKINRMNFIIVSVEITSRLVFQISTFYSKNYNLVRCNTKTLWINSSRTTNCKSWCIHVPACTKVLKRENGMMHQWQHWPVSSQDVTPSENRPEHWPSAMSIL